MSGGPLEGVRVIDLTSVVVGPLATQIMADHGADVIKVEAPEGDIMRRLAGRSVTAGMSPKFLHLNRNKRSIALDLKQPAGYAALLKLLEEADVFVWNMRPAAIARLKLTHEDVRKINPRLITCAMFGFGQDGCYRDKPAYDTIIQGAAGFAALNHRALGEPRYFPMVIADRSVGLVALQMILMCLYRRERTGEGEAIEVPMFENTAKAVLEEHMYLRTFEPPLGGTGDPRLLDPAARPLPTKDGWICITGNTNEQAFVMFDAIGRPELKADPRFCSLEARFEQHCGVLLDTKRRYEAEDDGRMDGNICRCRRAGDALPNTRADHRRSAYRAGWSAAVDDPSDRRTSMDGRDAQQAFRRLAR